MNRVVLGPLFVTMLLGVAGPARGVAAVGPATPQGAVLGYLEAARRADWARAAEHLDLRRIPPESRAARGAVLARDLGLVLDRALRVEAALLSDEPGGDRDDGLGAHLERVGTITTRRGPVDVLLERVAAAEGPPVWKFSGVTVAQIPALHREVGAGPLAERLPAPLVEIRVLEVALWQWIGLLLVLAVAAGAAWLAVRGVTRVARPLLARISPALHDRILHAALGPLRLGVVLALVSIGVLPLGLALPVLTLVAALQRALAIVAVAWLLVRMVDLAASVMADQLAAAGRTAALATVTLGRRSAKGVVLGLGFLAVLQNLGVNVTGVLAGIGIGGLAVALAAQKTIENLFGGITLVADQPVRVGDFCRFGDRLGTVEEIGLRSTRIRTLDRTVVSVPNATFASMELENFAKRDRIWFRAQLGLRYETTPDQLRYVLVEIRRVLYAHPKVDPVPARVRFVGFGAFALEVEIFAYVLTTDMSEFMAIREDIYLRLMDIVEAAGAGFAFPSQTTYLARDRGPDPSRRQAAEARVQAWRAARELCLPEFPPDRVEALRNTLEYPPEGAAVRRAGSA